MVGLSMKAISAWLSSEKRQCASRDSYRLMIMPYPRSLLTVSAFLTTAKCYQMLVTAKARIRIRCSIRKA